MNNELALLCGAGLALVSIPPDKGKPTKAPDKGWNKQRSPVNPGGYSTIAADFTECTGFNFGLYHGASNTLALDLDDVELSRKIFEDTADTQLADWLNDDLRVEVKSPKANRGKLLFKLPVGFDGAGLRQLKHDGKVIFELRSGNCQDVIFGRHPEGGDYKLIGNPAAIPEAPEVLLDMLQNWEAWKPCFGSALGIDQEPPPIAPRGSQQGENITGWRNPIQEFNRANSVHAVLLANGYKQVGKDRLIRPGSASKAPGAVLMRNCSDGIERVYSHGGDVLSDGFAHDAFDCYRLLEHGGDWKAALDWNSEITKHNQRLYMQEQAKNAPQEPPQPENATGKAKQPLFPLVSASKMTDKPIQVEWLVENILEQGSLNLLFGEPGAGKSLFALDWAWCMAAGLDWHEFRTKQTDVVIIAGEGFAGMARRLKALENKYQMKAPERLFISQRPAQLLDEKNALWVAESIKAMCPNPGLVIIDTLHRNMDGDENSSQDIGKFINNLDVFMKPLGAAVLVVHHSGHGDKQRSRGSSSIRAAMDGEFSATKSDGGIILACHKAKDFEALAPLQFALRPTDLSWLDEDGEPMTSVYLEHDGEAKPSSKKRKLSARDDAILTSLSESIVKYGVEPSTDIKLKFGGFDSLFGKIQHIVHVDHWRELAYKTISVDCKDESSKPEALKKAFKRTRDKLFNDGLTVEHGDYVWRVFE